MKRKKKNPHSLKEIGFFGKLRAKRKLKAMGTPGFTKTSSETQEVRQ